MKETLAEKGIFNKQGLTPMQSVEKANLHDVLFNLNLQSLKADEQKS